MNLIEELYFGKINPNEKRIDKESQYTKALARFCENENKLNKELTGENLHNLNQLINAHDETISCVGIENFKLGFIIGVKLIAECFNCEAKTIFKDI